MFFRLFIAILGFAIALCQASDGSYQPTPQHFKYWGCATVDAAGFSNPVPLPNGVLTPEMCKAACAYHMFAAVSPGACRCGDNPSAIKAIHEGFCNNPCNESPNSPMCGGGCPEDGDTGISNLFVIQPAIIQPAESRIEPGNQRNQLEPSTVLVPVSTSVVSFASAALPWQTSSSSVAPTFPPGQVPVPSSTAAAQGPPQGGSLLPSSGFVPVDPPTTSVGRVMATITSTVHVQPSLTWPDDEPPSTPGAPVVDPVSVSEGTGVVSTSASGSSLAGETLFTDTDPVPTPSSTVTEVPMSEANHFEIKLLVTLTELLLIAVVLV